MTSNHQQEWEAAFLKLARSYDSFRLQQFLLRCEERLKICSEAEAICILVQIGFLLSDGIYPSLIWSWLEARMFRPRPEIKRALTVSVLELIPQPPLVLADLAALWRLSSNPATSWALEQAYSGANAKYFSPHQRLFRLLQAAEAVSDPDE